MISQSFQTLLLGFIPSKPQSAAASLQICLIDTTCFFAALEHRWANISENEFRNDTFLPSNLFSLKEPPSFDP